MSRFFSFLLIALCLLAQVAFGMDWKNPGLTEAQKKHYQELYEQFNDEWESKLKNANDTEKHKIHNAWGSFQNTFQALLYSQGELNDQDPNSPTYQKTFNKFSQIWDSLNKAASKAKLQTRLPSKPSI